jgi:fructuronate reductase
LDALRAGRMPLRLALAAAAWMRYLTGVDESGQAYALNDPMADALQALATEHAGDPGAAAAALGALTPVWGAELPRHAAWMACVTDFRRRIDRVGLRAVLVALEIP